MGRPRRFTLFPVALSPSAFADAVGLSARRVRDAIADGSLPGYQIGAATRVLIADGVKWISSFPRKQIRALRRKRDGA
jgi:hypothetical protein